MKNTCKCVLRTYMTDCLSKTRKGEKLTQAKFSEKLMMDTVPTLLWNTARVSAARLPSSSTFASFAKISMLLSKTFERSFLMLRKMTAMFPDSIPPLKGDFFFSPLDF